MAEGLDTPEYILPSSCKVDVMTWSIEKDILETQWTKPDPSTGPPAKMFVPTTMWNHNAPGHPAFGREKLHTSNYSLVILIQLSLLTFDLFVNSFSELLRTEPAVQLVLFIIQDICILFNLIIVLLMLFNTYVFQVGLVAILLERFRALLMLSALYLTFSIILHCWLVNLRWLNANRFVWTDGLQVLFMFQRSASVLYYYFYKRTSEYLGDPRLYEDSPWLREVFALVRQ
ncbi:transmembrane protein 138-like [Nematolebias whitei]|uniref:transmembrane protein 138-like n=1 Tax=Nematolebias whitei TaxID=451745 RepID=UPI0018975A79|nr:transmembrane protein 138-like [Nematolebias whitei]